MAKNIKKKSEAELLVEYFNQLTGPYTHRSDKFRKKMCTYVAYQFFTNFIELRHYAGAEMFGDNDPLALKKELALKEPEIVSLDKKEYLDWTYAYAQLLMAKPYLMPNKIQRILQKYVQHDLQTTDDLNANNLFLCFKKLKQEAETKQSFSIENIAKTSRNYA